ncbi:MAG: AAA family ATPase [Myxococcales bacterium]|nr:AAA family ATPase [Myxococcales bacterium]
MTTTHSPELAQVYAQARDIARQTGQPLSTAHILFAVFTVPNLAELLLLERQINEETVLAHVERMEPEPDDTLDLLDQRARRLAQTCREEQVNCLHLLAALTWLPRAFAWRLLDRTGTSMLALRETALRYATHGVPHRLFQMRATFDEPDPTRHDRETIQVSVLPRENDRDTSLALPAVGSTRPRTSLTAQLEALGRVEVVEDAAPTAEDSTDVGPPAELEPAEAPPVEAAPADARPSAPPEAAPQATPTEAPRKAPPAVRTALKNPLPETAPSPFVLHREKFRWLHQLGRNLSHLAWLGRLDPVIGREREIEEILDILNKRRSNNPCLLGEPGVGKTAVVEGVAQALVRAHGSRNAAPERVVIQVDVGALLAGTHLRGAFAERLRGLQEEARQANGRVVIFIDELHTLIGAGGGDGVHDAANELKAALARGEFPCIGATTTDEYRQHIEADPALDRRFSPVHVDEPSEETTRRILIGVLDRYAAHHGVRYRMEAVDAAVRMCRRYMHDRRDPDRSLGVLDLAGAVARRRTREVDARAVAEVVARVARVPVDHLLMDDPRRFLEMESHLGRQIVGQRHVLGAISETVRRNYVGFAGRRPIGSFLFLGPTGVGKTEAVKALAAFLFGSRDALVRFDMSEFAEPHSLARLIGAPPGYVGHQEGGQLTDALRKRPYQVVLFDEIEKSHRDVWNVLLQVLDEGRLTDARGRTVDFSNTVVVLTSNLGAEVLLPKERRIGFAGQAGLDADALAEKALETARGTFPPELWNRIEARLVFHPLDRPQVEAIAELIAAERSALLAQERNIRFTLTPAAIGWLVEAGGFDARLGARPMRQTIGREVESRIARGILAGDIRPGDDVRVDAADDGLVLTTQPAA